MDNRADKVNIEDGADIDQMKYNGQSKETEPPKTRHPQPLTSVWKTKRQLINPLSTARSGQALKRFHRIALDHRWGRLMEAGSAGTQMAEGKFSRSTRLFLLSKNFCPPKVPLLPIQDIANTRVPWGRCYTDRGVLTSFSFYMLHMWLVNSASSSTFWLRKSSEVYMKTMTS